MTKVSSAVHSNPQCSGPANGLSNAPGDTDSRQAPDEMVGFRQLLAESGVDHVHGMEILRLIKMCAGAYDRILAERMREEEISLPQWRILIRLYLAERDGQAALMPTDLANSQRLSKNTISAHLRTLEELRLIERQLDPNDLRAFRIRLTTDSRSLIRSSTPLHLEFLNELIAQLSPAECEMLQGLLAKLVESLQWNQEKSIDL